MKRVRVPLLLILAVALAAQQPRAGRRGQERRGARSDGIFHTEVPAHRFDVILTRPEARSVTATILAYEDLAGSIECGEKRTAPVAFPKNTPVSVVLDGLEPDTAYSYRLWYRSPGAKDHERSPEYSFHTQRKAGSPFTFAVQADSHLDENTDTETYKQTLRNMLAAGPDFVVDLGDTFMTDKRRDRFQDAHAQYLAQRYYFGLVCHSVPLFLVLGNHDGEGGARHDGTADSMAAWSHRQRTRLFPNPRPDGFYSGNGAVDPALGHLENYFAWEWGDALLVVLDPYWSTKSRGGEDNWHWTLGAAQYRWLKETLGKTRAAFKFVFIHHPVGAEGQPIRGGVEAARYNEWGGLNRGGSNGFAANRPGWDMPVHQLLVRNKVSVVFHGHDHLFAREELDGVVYQLVPQPGNPRGGVPRSAKEYGYIHGDVLGGSGYLRVGVNPNQATIEYVTSVASGNESQSRRNASVAHSYTVRVP